MSASGIPVGGNPSPGFVYVPGPLAPIDEQEFRRSVRASLNTDISDGFAPIAAAMVTHGRLFDDTYWDFWKAAQLPEDPGNDRELIDMLDDVAAFRQLGGGGWPGGLLTEVAGAEGALFEMVGAFAAEQGDPIPHPENLPAVPWQPGPVFAE